MFGIEGQIEKYIQNNASSIGKIVGKFITLELDTDDEGVLSFVCKFGGEVICKSSIDIKDILEKVK